MTTGGIYRDVGGPEGLSLRSAPEGRAYIAVIGIDRYRTWNRLYNAVSDANGALRLFAGLGFELVTPPLFDDSATAEALRRLVVDDLSGLGENDSLVLFFAGHGHTVTRSYGGANVRDAYLIPVDGARARGRAATWIRLESWLTDITRIPARHILVILDACHSGLALGPILKWRSRGMENARREPLEQLRVRRSRRIITSALDDQLAMDGGPMPGHSLFTGCLIEAMTGGLVASTGHEIVSGSEIGHYVQRRVSEYPGSSQTPDFGALELDDRGELLVRLQSESAHETQAATAELAVEGAGSGAEPHEPGSAQPSELVAGTASQASKFQNPGELRPPARRRALYWGFCGLLMMVAGAAVLLAIQNTASVEDSKPPFSMPSDAGAAVVVVPSDATVSVATPDAAEPSTIDAAVTPEKVKADKKNAQQPIRRVGDVNSSSSNRPPIDDRGN